MPVNTVIAAPISLPTKYATTPKIKRNIPPVIAFCPPALVMRAVPMMRNPRIPSIAAFAMPVSPFKMDFPNRISAVCPIPFKTANNMQIIPPIRPRIQAASYNAFFANLTPLICPCFFRGI